MLLLVGKSKIGLTLFKLLLRWDDCHIFHMPAHSPKYTPNRYGDAPISTYFL